MKCSRASQTCPVVGGSPTEMRSGQGLLGVWAWAGWSWGRTGGVGSGAIASGGSLVVGASALRSGAGASGERHLVHRGPGGRWQPSCGFGQNSTSFPFDFLLALPLTCEGSPSVHRRAFLTFSGPLLGQIQPFRTLFSETHIFSVARFREPHLLSD